MNDPLLRQYFGGGENRQKPADDFRVRDELVSEQTIGNQKEKIFL